MYIFINKQRQSVLLVWLLFFLFFTACAEHKTYSSLDDANRAAKAQALFTDLYSDNSEINIKLVRTEDLPEKRIYLAFDFSNLPPNEKFTLFSPNTGDLKTPEFSLDCETDSEGNLLFEAGSSKLRTPQTIHLPKNPGFQTDWYLLGVDCEFRKGCSYIYEPIIATENEQKLEVIKKEVGGNWIEIRISGFPPQAKIPYTLEVNAKTTTGSIQTDSMGRGFEWVLPKIEGINTGEGIVTIHSFDEADANCLQVKYDWDSSTLLKRRVLSNHSSTQLLTPL